MPNGKQMNICSLVHILSVAWCSTENYTQIIAWKKGVGSFLLVELNSTGSIKGVEFSVPHKHCGHLASGVNWNYSSSLSRLFLSVFLQKSIFSSLSHTFSGCREEHLNVPLGEMFAESYILHHKHTGYWRTSKNVAHFDQNCVFDYWVQLSFDEEKRVAPQMEWPNDKLCIYFQV